MDENSKTVTNKVREKRRRNNSNLFYIQSFLILIGIAVSYTDLNQDILYR